MSDSTLSTVMGDGVHSILAPDLDYPSAKNAGLDTRKQFIFDASSGLTSVLSLTGKYVISNLELSGLTTETITIKLTIDGATIWNDTFICSTSEDLFGSNNNTFVPETMQCNSSFLLEVQTATDNNVTLAYLLRPIL